MSEFEPTNQGGHARMLELSLIGLVVGTWICFVAYGVWFFSSAKKRGREAEVQEAFSGLKNSRSQRISRRVSAPEKVRKSIPKPPKRPETVRARAGSNYLFINEFTRSDYSFVNGLAIGLGLAFLETFVILWMSIFYASQLSTEISYEKMISALIYPLLFLLATGTVFLTMGIVREYVCEYMTESF